MKKGGMTWLYPQNYCNKENLKQVFIFSDLLLFYSKNQVISVNILCTGRGHRMPQSWGSSCSELSDTDAGNRTHILLRAVFALNCWAISPDPHFIFLHVAFLLFNFDVIKWKFYDS